MHMHVGDITSNNHTDIPLGDIATKTYIWDLACSTLISTVIVLVDFCCLHVKGVAFIIFFSVACIDYLESENLLEANL